LTQLPTPKKMRGPFKLLLTPILPRVIPSEAEGTPAM
jgi:hypothetical protein